MCVCGSACVQESASANESWSGNVRARVRESEKDPEEGEAMLESVPGSVSVTNLLTGGEIFEGGKEVFDL